MSPDMYPESVKQFSSTQRDTAVEAVFDCTAEVFAGLEKVVELNVQAVKMSLSEQQALADAALAARSLTEVVDLQSQQLPATVKKTVAYWRHMEDIANETRAGMFGVVQDRLAGTLQAFIDTMNVISGGATSRESSGNGPLLIAGKPAADVAGSVALVDSSGNVVSSVGMRDGLH